MDRPQDWPEDAGHENGAYSCKCAACFQEFTGHKRRVVCKECATRAHLWVAANNVIQGEHCAACLAYRSMGEGKLCRGVTKVGPR